MTSCDMSLHHMIVLQAFWEAHPFFDPTVCMPSDRMHQADQGIFKSILSWTVQLLEDMAMAKGGGMLMNIKINEMNRRFQSLVPFTDMKVFNQGVSHLTGLNAFEYRDMMKSCVVVFKGNQHKTISYDIILCHVISYDRTLR